MNERATRNLRQRNNERGGTNTDGMNGRRETRRRIYPRCRADRQAGRRSLRIQHLRLLCRKSICIIPDSYVVRVLLVCCSHSLLYCPPFTHGKNKERRWLVGTSIDAAPTLSSKMQFSASTMADVIGLIGRTNRVR